MTALLEALAASGPSAMLRTSFWLYPLVSVLHVLSLGAVITSVLLMDLHVLGAWRRVPQQTMTGLLRPVAFASFAIVLLSGLMLFSVRPLAYLENGAFRLKLILIGLAVINAGAFFALSRGNGIVRKVLAALSLLLWPIVAIAGRFIGFVE